MWKHINQLTGKGSKTTDIQSIEVHNIIISNNEDIADVLNTYFTEIGPDLSYQIPQTNDKVDDFREPVSGLFNFKHISVQEATKALKMLDASKSCGLI